MPEISWFAWVFWLVLCWVVWTHFTIEKMPYIWWSVWARKNCAAQPWFWDSYHSFLLELVRNLLVESRINSRFSRLLQISKDLQKSFCLLRDDRWRRICSLNLVQAIISNIPVLNSPGVHCFWGNQWSKFQNLSLFNDSAATRNSVSSNK